MCSVTLLRPPLPARLALCVGAPPVPLLTLACRADSHQRHRHSLKHD